MVIDFNKALQEINAWKGAGTEYWVAVDILIRYNQVSEIELQRLKNGCDCWNEEFLGQKLSILRDMAKVAIESNKLISEIVISDTKFIPEIVISNPKLIPEIVISDTPLKRKRK